MEKLAQYAKWQHTFSLDETSSTDFSEAVGTLKVILAGLVSSVCGLWFV